MADDVDDAVGVSPFYKIDAHAGILFDAAYGAFLIPSQGFDRKRFVRFDTGAAADAGRQIERRLGHADDDEIVHADLAAVGHAT